jgi:electron transfer flavoprotein beta subunit
VLYALHLSTEEAIRLKEKKIATEIIAVSIGGKACQESLRTALAMGADRGIHIETNSRTDQEVQPLAVAKTLKFLAEVSFSIRDLLFVNVLRRSPAIALRA